MEILEMVELARTKDACAPALAALAACATWTEVAASPHAFDWLEWAIAKEILPKECVFAWAKYKEVRASAWAKYEEVRASAWAKYEEVCVPAWAKYEEVRASAWAKYEEVRASAWAKYEEVCVPAWAKCLSACIAILEREPGGEK